MLHHVAIIMDGNGRWAESRKLSRSKGHKKGAEAAKNIIKACKEYGVSTLTLYAFSSENWKRPEGEVTELMKLLRFYLVNEVKELHQHNIRISVIGDRSKFSPDIRKKIEDAETLTENNQALHLNIALSYGSRQEIVNAATQLATDIQAGYIAPDAITEELFSSYLYTKHSSDPDLLIRTGGEQRLSNFLLWQTAYTELFFTPTLWPDFSEAHFKEAIDAYTKRERRYGMTTEQVA